MKKGDARREQILLTAESLFYVNGYEQTSVQDILDALHLSKGGFYHHFDSKQSLLEAISTMRAEERFAAAQAAIEPLRDDPVTALNTLIDTGSVLRADRLDYVSLLLRMADREDGAAMQDALRQRSLEMLLPLMDTIIADGVAKGLFLLPHPVLAGELILRLSQQFTDGVSRVLSGRDSEVEKITAILNSLELYRHTVERMLCAPFGSVTLYELKHLVALVRGLETRKNPQGIHKPENT